MITLYLIRHGETEANVQGILQGNCETPNTVLTPHGIQTTETLRYFFSSRHIDVCYTSPLIRARCTANLIFDDAAISIREDPRLVEINYGQWNGQPVSSLKRLYPQYWSPISGDVTGDYQLVAQGESIGHVRHRIDTYLADLSARNKNKAIAIVTHGFIIQTILMRLGYDKSHYLRNLEVIQLDLK